ncbi:hypothetical protein WA158_002639 [Blastocystis sp. Blastoise]
MRILSALSNHVLVLQKMPENDDALKTKAICLIREGKFSDALRIIDNVSSDMTLERTYCLYNLKQYDEAYELIKNKNDRLSRLLLAQILYKQEKYNESLAIYEIFKKDENFEIITNICAAYTVSDQAKKGFELFQQYLNNADNYEVLYNIGCAYLSLGDLDQAQSFFNRSHESCDMMIKEEGIENNDVYELIAPIEIQLAYIASIRGDKETSVTLLSNVMSNIKNIKSEMIKSICINNLVIMKYNKDFFDAYKKMRSLTDDIINRMTVNQKKIIYVNKALLLLYMGKKTEFMTMCDMISKEDPILSYILKVSECINRKKVEEGITLLKDVDNNKDIQLILIQLYINQGMYKEALDHLLLLKDILYKPAIQCLCIYICKHINDQTITSKVIQESLACAPTAEASITIYELNASFLLAQKQYQEAMMGYQHLLEQKNLSETSRLRILASLVLAASHVDLNIAEQYSKQLPSVENNYGESDILGDDLEQLISQRNFIKPRKTSIEISEKPTVEEEKKKKSANRIMKKKQKKLQAYIAKLKAKGEYKDVSEMDSERWLPLKERTYMRKRRRLNKNNQITGIGAQGTGSIAEDEAAKYDAKARAEQRKLNPKPTAAPQETPKKPTAPVIQAKVIKAKSKMGKKIRGKKGK